MLKHISIIAVMSFIVLSSVSGEKSLSSELKLEITVNTSETANTVLVLEALGGRAPYTFKIFNKEPWNKGELIKEINSSDPTVNINDIKPGSYFICVTDNNDVSSCRNFNLP